MLCGEVCVLVWPSRLTKRDVEHTQRLGGILKINDDDDDWWPSHKADRGMALEDMHAVGVQIKGAYQIYRFADKDIFGKLGEERVG